ncbi:MgtC/SapB family protein [Clostridium oceanicum]|uniref:MgtC/SapB family protein n=1 Tax=Clostridium oceanicum TaxID=1543 RepID=A0ABP3V0E6_9CLOT
MNEKQVIIRLILCVLIGGLIGYEREARNRPAGFRTHILVCIGACISVMIQQYCTSEAIALAILNPGIKEVLKTDVTRISAQVITGIGFLGAGTIIRDKGSVKGLTTAASIWVVACIGMTIGLGYYFLSIVAFIMVIIVLLILKKLEQKIIDRYKVYVLQIEYTDKENFIEKILFDLVKMKVKIKKFEVCYHGNNKRNTNKINIYMQLPRGISINYILQYIQSNDNICMLRILKN